MPRDTFLPRAAAAELESILALQPVTVLLGARQVGKSTLAARLPALEGYEHLTLDSLATRHEAQENPEMLVRRASRLVIDEVQRVPDLLIAIKREVDLDRRPGRFVLTGSADLLSMKAVKETLAGRASHCTLWLLARRERLGLGTAGCWSALTESPARTWPDVLRAQLAPPDDWRRLVRQSGYPPVVVGEYSAQSQSRWLQGYIDAFVEHEIADVTRISRPMDLARLMRAAAVQVGNLEHQAEWARLTGLPTSTTSRWIDLLEVLYQLVRVPAFAVNRAKRLVKGRKIYWTDPAMALELAGQSEPTGSHLENLVLHDLLAWSSSMSPRPRIHHWRTRDQLETDFVLELPSGGLIGVEVKAERRPEWGAVRGLVAFLAEYRAEAVGGLVLHGGDEVYHIAENIVAAPWWRAL
jgi:hypothetical protein